MYMYVPLQILEIDKKKVGIGNNVSNIQQAAVLKRRALVHRHNITNGCTSARLSDKIISHYG